MTTSAQDQQTKLLGKDLYFDGDFAVTAAGDYATLEGLAAFRQSIYRRLITRPGEYRARPDYGCGVLSFVKKRLIQSELDDLKGRITDQLSLDPRLSEVTRVVIERIENGIRIGIAVRAAGESLVFEPFDFTETSIESLLGGS